MNPKEMSRLSLGRVAVIGVAMMVATACNSGSASPSAAASQPNVASPSGASADPASPSATAAAELKPLTLILNGPGAGSSAGYMYAKDLGLYEAQGLDVRIDESGGSQVAANAVAAGQYDFGLANAPTAMLTVSQGAKLKLLTIDHQSNGFAITSLTESNIKDIQDLKGKTVGQVPGGAQASIFEAALGANGLTGEVEVVNIDPSALEAALLQKQVDAILGAAVANSVNLRAAGHDVTDILFSDIGVPTVGLGLTTSETMIEEDPETVRKFVAASLEGWDRARQDVDAAAAAVFKQFPAGTSEDTLKLQTEAVTSKSLCVDDSISLGRPSQALLDTSFDLLTKYQDLPATPDVNSYFDWSFLPEPAPEC